jgi:hypothetical protein
MSGLAVQASAYTCLTCGRRNFQGIQQSDAPRSVGKEAPVIWTPRDWPLKGTGSELSSGRPFTSRETAEQTDPSPVSNSETSRKSVDISYVLLGLCTLAVYLVAKHAIDDMDQTVVPRGDAFTYAISLFQILNTSRESMGSALRLVMSGNFIWLQHLLVWAFSPFLSNRSGSLIAVNYFGFFVSLVVVYRTALLCGVQNFWAFAATALFAALPWNFRALLPFNLTSLMPEPLVVSAFLCAMLLLCWFVAEPRSAKRAFAAGVAVGLVIWSRGNAVVYLAMPLAGFSFVVLIRALGPKSRTDALVVKNFGIFVLTCLTMAAIYFSFTYYSIYNYYFADTATAFSDYQAKLQGSAWIILNVPGRAVLDEWVPAYLYINGTSAHVVTVTVLCHAIVIYSAVSGIKRLRAVEPAEVLVGAMGTIGAATFYLYLIFALITFSGFYSRPDIRLVHPLEPALVGFICCALAVVFKLLAKRRLPRIAHEVFYVVVGVVLVLWAARATSSSFDQVFGFYQDSMWTRTFDGKSWSFAHQPKTCHELNQFEQTYLPSGDVSQLSLLLSKAALNKMLYFFWGGTFNSQLVEYYAVQANMAAPSVVTGSQRDQYYWFQTLTPQVYAPERYFREFLKLIFAKADFIVIPEQLDALTILSPSPIVAYRKDIPQALNSPDIAPDYDVWAIVDERPVTRLLILEKHDPMTPKGDLEQFPRTWDTAAQIVGRDFKGARVISQKAWWEPDIYATPELLYAYHGYNVVRMGRAYVGLAQNLGPIDTNQVLAGTAFRPPLDEFVLARDPSRVEKAIDACRLAG